MKLLWAILLYFVASELAEICTNEEKRNAEKIENFERLKSEAIAECCKLLKISQDEIDDILNHAREADVEIIKDWISCVMKKVRIMKDGKSDQEFCAFITKLDFNDDTDTSKVVEISHTRVPECKTGECQLRYSMVVCKIWSS